MISLLKNIILNLGAIVLLGLMLYAIVYINIKIDQMNSLWLDANQVVVDNQKHQIKINKAYSEKLDNLTSHISSLDTKDRTKWSDEYKKEIQDLLSTPPEGLSPQGGLT